MNGLVPMHLTYQEATSTSQFRARSLKGCRDANAASMAVAASEDDEPLPLLLFRFGPMVRKIDLFLIFSFCTGFFVCMLIFFVKHRLKASIEVNLMLLLVMIDALVALHNMSDNFRSVQST